jgi:hypothetical protein
LQPTFLRGLFVGARSKDPNPISAFLHGQPFRSTSSGLRLNGNCSDNPRAACSLIANPLTVTFMPKVALSIPANRMEIFQKT